MGWQIWEQLKSKLPRTQDPIINLQGRKSKLPKQGDASCQMWAGESTQVPEDGNYVAEPQGESSSSIKNQEFPTRPSWDFWKKMYLRESQNYQRRSQQIDIKNKPGEQTSDENGKAFSLDSDLEFHQQLPQGEKPCVCILSSRDSALPQKKEERTTEFQVSCVFISCLAVSGCVFSDFSEDER
ncbi:Zinc finger protein 233 [Camelus dromedarius]|uniref:Zinc finger protein 233 n=1 Tax=Camelus dromedarius TaxID=9838 RepID=A0A5N4DSN1_CAMDR|nr:Zinc finger protein 233 [Camelus dromedarius]